MRIDGLLSCFYSNECFIRLLGTLRVTPFLRVIRCIGKNGEYYLARTKPEYFHIFGASGGAGVITTTTVICKFLIGVMKLPHFAESLLFGLNYAGSFLLIQCLGFRLATKQPSLLAVTLLRRTPSAWCSELIAISRSQVAATLGNFGFAICSMILFHCLYLGIVGTTFLSTETALYTFQSLNPFRSGTLAFAALTGVLLWISSLVSGWCSHKTRRHRLQAYAGGIGFNLSLAFLLCAVPVLGKVLGLPLDVRHFTLSSASLSLSVYTLGLKGAWNAELGQACFGIFMIGVLNFAVSFALSFFVALAAYPLRRRKVRPLYRKAWALFIGNPWSFLYPGNRH